MAVLKITTYSAKETQKVARLLAREILRSDIQRDGALAIALEGDLGGGKTTFSQGFAKGLGIREKILSPTFVIMKSFRFHASGFRKFVHIDAYRLSGANELRPLGWKDILQDKNAIVLVEWADRVRRALPKGYVRIQFEFVDKKTRKIKINS
ncbi:MAG: UPF0079 ATP-binding protein [Parcubacteria group bacterium Gr01-1014_29]|nr:MAG: UPF0079 ATP-binding protein [Parcubacteria group bacterium Gr01-1014_29]